MSESGIAAYPNGQVVNRATHTVRRRWQRTLRALL